MSARREKIAARCSRGSAEKAGASVIPRVGRSPANLRWARAIFTRAKSKYNYDVSAHWERKRNALVASACEEFPRLARILGAYKARRVLTEKYQGLSLGGGKKNREITLRLSSTALWRVYRKWRSAAPRDRTPELVAGGFSRSGRKPKVRLG